MDKAGFDAVAPLLSAPQSAALAVVREYVRLRQGEVWRDIAAAFEAEGLAPSQEDCARIDSGIRAAESLAASVRTHQEALLRQHAAEAAASEAAGYAAALAQAAAEAEAKVFRRDTVKLTMRERLAAKAQREDMLRRSVVAAREGDGAGGGGAAAGKEGRVPMLV
ncbi:hypothetical protein MNEG_4654 [Monoraphidium neglectum]|uniref:Uncharacterized protein n=1 Tax=Monoraphidium neglectum TaxID=145388 RepID=A0A0D2L8Z1_9CHLO|nr:hypothetical protein MNEG_4654 [Monoraphidium neglectum]KIZ03304.1 hypothetical protein MNEG_4654 [Monoraphidium neglectum]|eukprot:XP_013902323.1 hypothetical protein MNEG_4654 [Monoraphidium neglectum]